MSNNCGHIIEATPLEWNNNQIPEPPLNTTSSSHWSKKFKMNFRINIFWSKIFFCTVSIVQGRVHERREFQARRDSCKGQHCKQSKSLFIGSSFSSQFLGIQLVPIKQKLQSKFATMWAICWIMLLIGRSLEGQTNSRHHNLQRSANMEGSGQMTYIAMYIPWGR